MIRKSVAKLSIINLVVLSTAGMTILVLMLTLTIVSLLNGNLNHITFITATIVPALVIPFPTKFIFTEIKRIIVNENKLQKELEDLRKKIGPLKEDYIHVCSHCKSVKNVSGHWIRFEEYFYEFLNVDFSHGVCPVCKDEHYSSYGV